MIASEVTYTKYCIFRVLQVGDHLVVIGDNYGNCEHGIFLGRSEGVVNLGSENRPAAQTEDISTFVKYSRHSLLRINYTLDRCIDPSITLSHALKKDLFDEDDSGAQKAIKCKIGTPAQEQTLRSVQRYTKRLMWMQYHQNILRQIKRCCDDVMWFLR